MLETAITSALVGWPVVVVVVVHLATDSPSQAAGLGCG